MDAALGVGCDLAEWSPINEWGASGARGVAPSVAYDRFIVHGDVVWYCGEAAWQVVFGPRDVC